MVTYFKLIAILLLFTSSFSASAQWKGNEDVTKPYAEGKNEKGEETQVREAPRNIGRVQGTVGSVYNAQDITRMATRNINKISSMTLGVQSFPGQEPIFKGALGGTAYFVDGVRVRSGSLGLAGYSY